MKNRLDFDKKSCQSSKLWYLKIAWYWSWQNKRSNLKNATDIIKSHIDIKNRRLGRKIHVILIIKSYLDHKKCTLYLKKFRKIIKNLLEQKSNKILTFITTPRNLSSRSRFWLFSYFTKNHSKPLPWQIYHRNLL